MCRRSKGCNLVQESVKRNKEYVSGREKREWERRRERERWGEGERERKGDSDPLFSYHFEDTKQYSLVASVLIRW
jgi:hypothetical protein